MALSGLAIYKHLPKENCKECGLPTCLAFAMKVASGQAGLEECPRLGDDARSALEEASAPPQRLVTIGEGDQAVGIGQETVMFRHDEKFHNPCGIAVRVHDSGDDSEVDQRLSRIKDLSFERMGRTMAVDMVAVENSSGDAARFTETARKAAALEKAVVLISSDPTALKAAGEAIAQARPLLHYSGGADSLDAAIEAAAALKLPLGLQSPSLEEIADMVEKAREGGLQEMVISPGPGRPAEVLEFLTKARRAALKRKFRPLGYPSMAFAPGEDDAAIVAACWYVLKYAGIVVIDTVEPAAVLAILTSRFNIYTDPQKPVQVEAGIYEINEPGAESPLLVTTNFALSYYSVESEVEASRVPSRILAVDTEGTSVLTAWAADKFNPETINEALVKSGAGEKVSHKKCVIPGMVAVISGSLEEESGWEVEVGPKEAVGIVSYLTSRWKK